MVHQIRWVSLALLVLIAIAAQPLRAVTIATVTIGDPGNPADTEVMLCCEAHTGTTGYGSVGYRFRMGKTEVTNAQYTGFLNAVASSDPYQLYNPVMSIYGIIRNGSDGSYTYELAPPATGQGPGGTDYAFEDKPIANVTWYDAIRFANWMHNGQGDGDTENGAYTLLGGTPTPSNANTITRNPGARWWIPNEDEWYKAALYDPVTEDYFDFPTGSNTAPADNLPSMDLGNSANYSFATGTGSAFYRFTDAGAYTQSGSPYGTFDQGGNVWEWNETLIARSAGGFLRGKRGSYWAGTANQMHSFLSGIEIPESASNSTGFRIAGAIPEPGAAALLALGAVGGLFARQRFTTIKRPPID